MQDVDVLIVGGGPAGLAAAEVAAPHGRVLVVHKDKAIGHPVRTSGASWRNAVDALGIPPALYHPIGHLNFASPSRDYRFAFAADPPIILDVTGTYRFLAKHAERAGAEIRRETRFLDMAEEDGEAIVCAIAGPSGHERIRARYLIDASGGWRAVLAQLPGIARSRRYGVGVEYEFENRVPNDETATLFVGNRFAPAGYGWIFPTRAGTTRVGIGVIRPDSEQSPGLLMRGFLASALPQRFGLDTGRLVESHSGTIPSDGALRAFVFGRIVAVGDSAGQALPLLGEGIRYSIESGRRAGAAIAACLVAGRHSPEPLAAYARWWNRKYRLGFVISQAVNERISRYPDEKWDDALRILESLSGDELAPLLRAEIVPRQFLRLLRRKPLLLVRFLKQAATSLRIGTTRAAWTRCCVNAPHSL